MDWENQVKLLLKKTEDASEEKIVKYIEDYLIEPLDDPLIGILRDDEKPREADEVDYEWKKLDSNNAVIMIPNSNVLSDYANLEKISQELQERDEPTITVDLRWKPHVIARRDLLAFPFLFVDKKMKGNRMLKREHRGWSEPDIFLFDLKFYENREVFQSPLIYYPAENMPSRFAYDFFKAGKPPNIKTVPDNKRIVILVNKVSLTLYYQEFDLLVKHEKIELVFENNNEINYPDPTLDDWEVDLFFHVKISDNYTLNFPKFLPMNSDGKLGLRFHSVSDNIVEGNLSHLGKATIYQNANSVISGLESTIRVENIYRFLKYWEVIRNFHPFLEYAKKDWYQVFEDYLPQILELEKEEEIWEILKEVVNYLRDGHAFVSGDRPTKSYPGIFLQTAENRVFFDDIIEIDVISGEPPQKHDEILEIDGKTPREIVEHYRKTATSETIKDNPFENTFGNSQKISSMSTEIKDEMDIKFLRDGTEYEVKLKRNIPAIQHARTFNTRNKTSRFGEIGYLNLVSIESIEEFDHLLDQLRDCKALIIDNRGYGHFSHYTTVTRFADDTIPYAPTKYPLVKKPRGIDDNLPIDRFETTYSSSMIPEGLKDPYLKPMVMLISARTGSMSEGTAIIYGNLEQVTLMGRRTGGAFGAICPVFFGPDIYVSFSGFRQDLPNGQIANIFGIVPDIIVNHKVENYLNGVDDDIKTAIDYLETKVK